MEAGRGLLLLLFGSSGRRMWMSVKKGGTASPLLYETWDGHRFYNEMYFLVHPRVMSEVPMIRSSTSVKLIPIGSKAS